MAIGIRDKSGAQFRRSLGVLVEAKGDGGPITEIVMNAERPRFGGRNKIIFRICCLSILFPISNQRIQVIE